MPVSTLSIAAQASILGAYVGRACLREAATWVCLVPAVGTVPLVLAGWLAVSVVAARIWMTGGQISVLLRYTPAAFLPLTTMALLALIGGVRGLTPRVVLGGGLVLAGIALLGVLRVPPIARERVRARDADRRHRFVAGSDVMPPDARIEQRLASEDTPRLARLRLKEESRNAFVLPPGHGTLALPVLPDTDALAFSIGVPGRPRSRVDRLKLRRADAAGGGEVFDLRLDDLAGEWTAVELPAACDGETVKLEWEHAGEDSVYVAPAPAVLAGRAESPRDVIVLSLDGLIPDVLEIYGGRHGVAISQFFRSGVAFAGAYSQGEWTLPTFASMATGQYASRHGVFDPDRFTAPMRTDVPTLGEHLQKQGLNTFAWLVASRASAGYGHARGFNVHFHSPSGRVCADGVPISGRQTAEAIRFLWRNRSSSNFVFLHFFDTHAPYLPPSVTGLGPRMAVATAPVSELLRRPRLDAEQFEVVQELYLATLAHLDRQLAILFDYIERDAADRTAVILTADHGTTIFEPEDSRFPAQDLPARTNLGLSVLRVPFLIRSPFHALDSLDRDAPIEANVTLCPTVLSLLDVDAPRRIQDGVSALAPPDGAGPKSYAVSESIYKEAYELMVHGKGYRYHYGARRERGFELAVTEDLWETFTPYADEAAPNEALDRCREIRDELRFHPSGKGQAPRRESPEPFGVGI